MLHVSHVREFALTFGAYRLNLDTSRETPVTAAAKHRFLTTWIVLSAYPEKCSGPETPTTF